MATSQGLETVCAEGEDGSKCLIYLNGATVAAWSASNSDNRLFVSSSSKMAVGEPLRGGIPIAFPQFAGDGPLPNHGFARTSLWTCVKQEHGRVVLSLRSNDASMHLWPYEFEAKLTVQFNAHKLTTCLSITNTDHQDIAFQALQHTYHRLSTPLCDEVQVLGLQERYYLDKTRSKREFQQGEPSLTVTRETDAIFPAVAVPGATAKVTLRVASNTTVVTFGARKFSVTGEILPQACDLVVWNPWMAKSKAMPDFGDEEYKQMICIEPGCVAEQVKLSSGQRFELTQELHVTPGSRI
eukprot:m.9691 g.9691  ORF g.9691 m.9691 type:complete len:297 (-) comp9480_c0_seq1:57-947(-)